MTATPDSNAIGTTATPLQEADEFIIRQRITPMVNRYEVHLPVAPRSQVRAAGRRSSPHQPIPVMAPAKWALRTSAEPPPPTP